VAAAHPTPPCPADRPGLRSATRHAIPMPPVTDPLDDLSPPALVAAIEDNLMDGAAQPG
jgi:hypothetical protein